MLTGGLEGELGRQSRWCCEIRGGVLMIPGAKVD